MSPAWRADVAKGLVWPCINKDKVLMPVGSRRSRRLDAQHESPARDVRGPATFACETFWPS